MTESNPNLYRGSAENDHSGVKQYTYLNDYQTDNYVQQQRAGVQEGSYRQSQTNTSGLYTVSNQNNYYSSSAMPVSSGSRVRT